MFAAAALVEVVLFYPAGTVMDRHGRVWVAVPVTVLLGLGLVALPFTTTLAGVGALALLMGVGNGLGSGIVMTLGADAAPSVGRAPFLGVWRLFSLVGHNGASIVVAAVAAVATIGVASVAVGLLTLAGGAWLARWLPEYDPRRLVTAPRRPTLTGRGAVGIPRASPGERRLARVTDLIDTTEMYLRTVFELEEEGITPLRARIAERLGHSGPTVSQTVARMERDGLLHVAGDRHLELSEHGRLLATRVMRKHRIAERLLRDVIGLEWEYVHDEACRWEHVMSERVERKILAMLPDHAESPYGNPIPGLDELGDLTELADFRFGLTSLDVIAGQGADHGGGPPHRRARAGRLRRPRPADRRRPDAGPAGPGAPRRCPGDRLPRRAPRSPPGSRCPTTSRRTSSSRPPEPPGRRPPPAPTARRDGGGGTTTVTHVSSRRHAPSGRTIGIRAGQGALQQVNDRTTRGKIPVTRM